MDTITNVLPNIKEKSITDNAFDKGLSSVGVTEAGQDWLAYALNLFADDPTLKAPCPDGGTQLTHVIEVPTYLKIKKPLSIPNGTKWGFIIVQTPFTERVDFQRAIVQGNQVTTDAPGQLAEIGGLYIQYYVEGTDVFDAMPAADMSEAHWPSTGGNKCDMRLVSQAFEVVSTAPKLTEQGDCVAFRSPVATNEDSRFFGSGATWTSYACRTMRMPPRNASEAIRLAGSRMWKASEGVLSQGYLEDMVNEIDLPSCNPILMIPNSVGGGQPGWYARLGRDTGFLPTQILNGMYNGAFFSNLNDDSTFSVIVKWAYELFPGVNDVPFIYDASLRPCIDNRALEIYFETIRSAPVGVPARDNASGDFWRGMKDLIWSAADTLSQTDIPIVSTVARLAKSGRNIYNAISSNKGEKQGGNSSKPKSNPPKGNPSGGGTKSQLIKGNPNAKKKKG
jgi:hypothetical protein